MAEEKKDPPITTATANDPASWVGAYYGDDAIDYSKKNKIRHIIRINQFASVAFIISKNTKKAHTDFFESNYTAIDTTYAKAAELIIRLLSVKYKEGRSLRASDFDNCGGKALFGDRPNYDQICSDYIGSGGMVEMCEAAFPTPQGEELKRDNESYVEFNEWLKTATPAEKQARHQEKMNLLYGSFVDDMENVKSDHTQILSVASEEEKKAGVLNGETMHKIYRTATDCGAKMQREWKDKKSKIDFTIRDDIEKNYELGYDAFKKTAKVGLLGGTAVASLGAVVGGVFWPAFLLVPAYALAKRWLPDWGKSLGAMWGHIEKSIGNRFQKQKIDSYYHYMISFMETGGKPKLRFKDRFFLTPGVIKTLKKGAKSGSVASTYEGTDEKVHKSEIDQAEARTSMAVGNLLNAGDADNLVPADKQALLNSNIENINVGNSTIAKFTELANRFNAWKDGLPGDAKYSVPIKYADKLNECVAKLIFDTPMQDIKYVSDVVNVALAEEGAIISMIKEIVPEHPVIANISRLKAFANKEIVGLDNNWQGKTLREYIERPGMDRVADEDLDPSTGGFVNAANPHLVLALDYIKNLERDSGNEKEKEVVITGYPGKTLKDIIDEIGNITDGNDRKKCNDLLQEQLKVVYNNGFRQDAIATLSALTDGTFTGKRIDINKFFEDTKNITYENIDSIDYSQLVYDITGQTKINPPAVGRFLRIKLGQTVREKFMVYLTQGSIRMEFSTDLKKLTTFLQKVNNCAFLNDQQKAELTAMAKGYVSEAFDKYIKDMSADFLGSYNSKDIGNYIDAEYMSGGFKTLFDTDKSAEVTAVKEKLTGLRRLKTAHMKLQFNGYNMSENDKQIIGYILLRDADNSFDSVKTRKADDALVNFLTNHLTTSQTYSNLNGIGIDRGTSTHIPGELASHIQSNGTYPELVDKLEYITDDVMEDCDFFDKYAALVALKNRSIVEFRQFLTQLVTDNCTSSTNADTWMQSSPGKELYREAIDTWGNGLFSQIDQAIVQIKLDAESTMSADDKLKFNDKIQKVGVTDPLSEEIKRYNTTFKLSLSENKTLGA